MGTFNPSSPSTNALPLNDDPTAPYGPNGVVMEACGTQISYCPRITNNLTASTTYHIVITSYKPNMTVSDGVNSISMASLSRLAPPSRRKRPRPHTTGGGFVSVPPPEAARSGGNTGRP